MDIIFPKHLSEFELKSRIEQADTAFENDLSKIAGQLASKPDLRLIGLTGPTCSGKTTAARMLTDRLFRMGLTVHVISIDDFYFEKSYLLSLSEENAEKELDYDSEKTIDTRLLQECVSSLLKGKPTLLPHFNFFTGLRESGIRLQPKENDLFLFEGIQVLYPSVSEILQGSSYQSVAICPRSGISIGNHTFLPNEIRLMRRLVRDSIYRGSSPAFTFFLWRSVRKNEEKNIFPNLQKCDHLVDSTMPYEIGVLKPYLQQSLGKIAASDPCFSTARNLLEALGPVETVDSNLISSNSLYREFI